MYIPDCRTDDAYNQKHLNERNKEFLHGYDYGISSLMNVFDNLEIYSDEMEIDDEDINLVRLFKNHPVIKNTFISCLMDYAEMERNELIVGLLDNQYADGEECKDDSEVKDHVE